MFPLIFLFPALAFAAFYGNQSGIKWKSAETERFLVHYPAEYREQAAQAVEVSESVYDTVVNRYNIKLPSKVNMVVNNGLFSNGEANPVYNMMQIWLTNWDFKVRGSHSWMRNVVTHEFSHLASMQSGSKTPFPWLHGLQISGSDFYNERRQVNFALHIPFMIQPFWFAEGTAQYESYRMGFDSWDTHRDMLLRTAFLENKVMPLEFMEDFSGQALEAELGPYTQGFDMIRYIAETYGDSIIPKLWKDMSTSTKPTLTGALKRRLNITEKELYANWKKNRLELYKKKQASLGKLNAGEKITKDAFYNDFISVINGKLYGLSNLGGDFFEGGVFEIKDSTPEPFEKFKLEKPYLSQGMSIKQTPNGLQLAYVSYKNRDKTGKPYFDIALADTLGNNRLLTNFADAVYPDISPDGKQITFVRREQNGTRFYLSIANTDKDSDKEYKDLIIPQGPEFNIYNPKFSPDGKKIAYSYFDGKIRSIGIININENPVNLSIVENPGSDKRDPIWHPSENSLYYSSDETGIFNIYKLNLQTKKTTQITNVQGGAFSPTTDTTGLYYIGYDGDGFSVYKISPDNVGTTLRGCPYIINNMDCQTTTDTDSITGMVNSIIDTTAPVVNVGATTESRPYIDNISLANSEHNYSPIPRMPILVPLFAFDDRSPDFGAINEGIRIPKMGLAFGLNDPLNKNFFQIAALQQIGKFGEDSQSDLFAALENRSFPITLNLAFMRNNTPSRDTVRYEDPRSSNKEDSVGVSEYASELYNALFSASYSVFKKGDTLTAFASYDWEAFNLYEDLFRWDYHKRLQVGLIAGISVADSLLSLQGLYSFSNSDLFRPGTFAESFSVSEAGAIIPHYRNFNLHEWAFSANISLDNPFQKYGKLSLSLFGGGILNWQSADSDTLDNFYLHPLVMEGYPILASSESYFRQGTGTVLAEARYTYPIYNEYRKRFWIFTTRNFNFSPFVQMGSAWENHPLPALKHRENWLQSFGINWRLENTVFYSVPFNFDFGVARGLDNPKSTRIRIGIGVM